MPDESSCRCYFQAEDCNFFLHSCCSVISHFSCFPACPLRMYWRHRSACISHPEGKRKLLLVSTQLPLLSAEFSWGMLTCGLYGQSSFQPRCFGLCRKLSKFPFLFYCLHVQGRLCKIWLIKGYSLQNKDCHDRLWSDIKPLICTTCLGPDSRCPLSLSQYLEWEAASSWLPHRAQLLGGTNVIPVLNVGLWVSWASEMDLCTRKTNYNKELI